MNKYYNTESDHSDHQVRHLRHNAHLFYWGFFNLCLRKFPSLVSGEHLIKSCSSNLSYNKAPHSVVTAVHPALLPIGYLELTKEITNSSCFWVCKSRYITGMFKASCRQVKMFRNLICFSKASVANGIIWLLSPCPSSIISESACGSVHRRSLSILSNLSLFGTNWLQ